MREQGYFDPGFVSELLDQHVARRQDHSRQLWGLMSFSIWAEQIGRQAAGTRSSDETVATSGVRAAGG